MIILCTVRVDPLLWLETILHAQFTPYSITLYLKICHTQGSFVQTCSSQLPLGHTFTPPALDPRQDLSWDSATGLSCEASPLQGLQLLSRVPNPLMAWLLAWRYTLKLVLAYETQLSNKQASTVIRVKDQRSFTINLSLEPSNIKVRNHVSIFASSSN